MTEDKAKEKAEIYSNFFDDVCECVWDLFLEDAQKWKADNISEIEFRGAFIEAIRTVNAIMLIHFNALSLD